MNNLIEPEFSLIKILVKTTYQIVVSKEKFFKTFPIAFGAGFFLNYNANLFFITADHNIHINDHEKNERTGVDNYVGVLNNISDRDTLSTIITPIGGFYYMEGLDDLNPELIDVAISLVDRTKFESLFLTDEDFPDENSKSSVSPEEKKMEFSDKHIVAPSIDDIYYIYGKVRPEIKGTFLHRVNTFKCGLRYTCTSGNFILLNTEDEISNVDDWAGLSGSPVLNQKGQCIGVLCSVNEGTKLVFVKPFSKITPFLDAIILQEQLNI